MILAVQFLIHTINQWKLIELIRIILDNTFTTTSWYYHNGLYNGLLNHLHNHPHEYLQNHGLQLLLRDNWSKTHVGGDVADIVIFHKNNTFKPNPTSTAKLVGYGVIYIVYNLFRYTNPNKQYIYISFQTSSGCPANLLPTAHVHREPQGNLN